MKRKIMALTVAVLMMAALAVGCSGSTEAANSNEVKEITLCETWGFEEGFSTVRTHEKYVNHGPRYYLGNVYETLVNYEDGKIVPGLADSWNVSDDGLIYIFHLKKGVKFSDGADFNADVVKKNLEMIPKLLGASNGSFGMTTTLFKEIKAVDDYVVEVHLTSPYYGALKEFTLLIPMSMMSPNAFNEDGTLSDKLLTSTMGTGPYMYEGQIHGNMYTFIRNPNYRGKKPGVDKFNIKIIPDNEAKALALRNCEIDMIVGADRISYDGFKEFSADSKFGAKISDATIKTRFLGLNPSKEPFNDKNVRLAVSHAIDKQNICDNLLYGIETKADTLLSKSLPYCNVAVKTYEYDIKKAKAILDEAGWIDSDGDGIREKDGMKLESEILYGSGNAAVENIVLAIASSLKEIGMNIKVTGLESMAYYAEMQQGNYKILFRETYGIPYDPFTLINNMSTERMADYNITQGLSHLEDGNSIIKGLITMVDEKEIQDRYNLILKEVHDSIAFVPISNKKELVVFNTEIIADYEFNSWPYNVDMLGVKLK